MGHNESRAKRKVPSTTCLHIELTQKKFSSCLTNHKRTEKEIRETIPFAIATYNIKYLGVTLTKQVKDLYDKNFKSLKKEIGEAIRRWKAPPCSWISRFNTVKMTIVPKQSPDSNNSHQNFNTILYRP